MEKRWQPKEAHLKKKTLWKMRRLSIRERATGEMHAPDSFKNLLRVGPRSQRKMGQGIDTLSVAGCGEKEIETDRSKACWPEDRQANAVRFSARTSQEATRESERVDLGAI